VFDRVVAVRVKHHLHAVRHLYSVYPFGQRRWELICPHRIVCYRYGVDPNGGDCRRGYL
jgi:hypothetical protein